MNSGNLHVLNNGRYHTHCCATVLRTCISIKVKVQCHDRLRHSRKVRLELGRRSSLSYIGPNMNNDLLECLSQVLFTHIAFKKKLSTYYEPVWYVFVMPMVILNNCKNSTS